jgi:hypothetical protein
MEGIRFENVQQEKVLTTAKTQGNLYRITPAAWLNKMCKIERCPSKHVQVKANGNSHQGKNTKRS